MKTTNVKHIKSATRSDIAGFVYDHLYEYGWKTTFNYYMHRPVKFLNKHLVIPEGNVAEFNKFVDYCCLLAKNFNSQDEAARYEGRYGLGIYFSVVLYWLLTSEGIINESRLNFCQGYYSLAVPGDVPGKVKYRAVMHSWLSCKGSVIDVTLCQQDIPGLEKYAGIPLAIRGRIPDNVSLIGFEENKSLAKEYARQFAKDSGLTFYDWLNNHREQANILDNVRRLEQEAEKQPKTAAR